jgi:hypothetical protein
MLSGNMDRISILIIPPKKVRVYIHIIPVSEVFGDAVKFWWRLVTPMLLFLAL